MARVIVVGGGWSGIAASVAAKKQGADVLLMERTDLLLGLGNVGGIMRNNGRFTATEENIAMGAGELFDITDKLAVHKNINFPGHEHASFYDVNLIEPRVRELLVDMDIEVKTISRVVDVVKEGILTAVRAADGKAFEADAFVDATGTTGPMGNCARYGNGCSMCVLRCPSFGPRVSLTEKAGLDDLSAVRENGLKGAFSGSCKIAKNSLSKRLQRKLSKDGYVVIPLPSELIKKEKLSQKVCQQYALDEYAENIIIIDTGEAKLMTPFFELASLRKIPGLENAKFLDPYAGGKANSVRYMSVGIRDEYMRAKGVDNLFLAGEKSGFFVGHTEAITTGTLAGYNAARLIRGKDMMTLPKELVTGQLLYFSAKVMGDDDCLRRRFTFAGGEFFERMKKKGLYLLEPKEIRKKVEELGLLNIYNKR